MSRSGTASPPSSIAMNHVPDLAPALHQPLRTARRTVRNRPRTFAAAALLVAVGALAGSGPLALVSTAPPAPAAAAAAAAHGVTAASGWTLTELERGRR